MKTLLTHSGMLLLVVCSLVLPPVAVASSAVEKGLSIAQEMKQRDRGWGDSTSILEMELFYGDGRSALREMRILSLEVEGDGDKSLTIFDNPKDVQGTAFLSYTHILEPDDQWLYLPALKRVKRIASKNKTSPFMGSEFTYEDLNSFEVERYDYVWLQDETMAGETCFVLEVKPLDPYSGYSKQIFWIDQSAYRLHKIDYYDRRGVLEKTLLLTDYHLHLQKFWRADTQTMINHRNQRQSVIHMKDYQFRVGLGDSDFTQNSLKRAR